jgi:predicted acetyltransferase
VSLTLRPPVLADEAVLVAGYHEIAAQDRHFDFLTRYDPAMAWADYVGALDSARDGLRLAPGQVPYSFLVAEVDGEIVGRVSIRFSLNDWLEHQGGHIGYGVLPAHRRRGYATEILRQALALARERGVERVLVTCDDDNAASAAVIERAGGVLQNVVDATEDGRPVRRYWFEPEGSETPETSG